MGGIEIFSIYFFSPHVCRHPAELPHLIWFHVKQKKFYRFHVPSVNQFFFVLLKFWNFLLIVKEGSNNHTRYVRDSFVYITLIPDTNGRTRANSPLQKSYIFFFFFLWKSRCFVAVSLLPNYLCYFFCSRPFLLLSMFTACLKKFVFLFFLASSFFLALDQFREWRLIRIIRMKNKKEVTIILHHQIPDNNKKPSWNVRESGRVEFLFDIFRARVVVFLLIRFSNSVKKERFQLPPVSHPLDDRLAAWPYLLSVCFRSDSFSGDSKISLNQLCNKDMDC